MVVSRVPCKSSLVRAPAWCSASYSLAKASTIGLRCGERQDHGNVHRRLIEAGEIGRIKDRHIHTLPGARRIVPLGGDQRLFFAHTLHGTRARCRAVLTSLCCLMLREGGIPSRHHRARAISGVGSSASQRCLRYLLIVATATWKGWAISGRDSPASTASTIRWRTSTSTLLGSQHTTGATFTLVRSKGAGAYGLPLSIGCDTDSQNETKWDELGTCESPPYAVR